MTKETLNEFKAVINRIKRDITSYINYNVSVSIVETLKNEGVREIKTNCMNLDKKGYKKEFADFLKWYEQLINQYNPVVK